jgi:DnaJ-class molecular chaperone
MTNSEKVQKPCGYCASKGSVAEDGFDGEIITCPVCKGSCKVAVAPETVLHLICDGTGKIKIKTPYGKQMVLCPDCQGTGWFKPPGF